MVLNTFMHRMNAKSCIYYISQSVRVKVHAHYVIGMYFCNIIYYGPIRLNGIFCVEKTHFALFCPK